MDNKTKILLGVAAASVVAYLVYNKKYSNFAAKPPKKKSKFLEFWDKVFSARAGVWIKKK